MHGIKRVVVFCILTTVLPTLLLVVPLYLRHSTYADVRFAVTESDVVEISDGISPIFCSEHTLRMNKSFNAFQVLQRPEKTSYRKHIRLKKSMTLPDDTLEYWGFYLLKGATVALSVCSRFDGSSIWVVKGERSLRTCGMLEHNKNKAKATGMYLPAADQQVKVTYESTAQEIDSTEHLLNSPPKPPQSPPSAPSSSNPSAAASPSTNPSHPAPQHSLAALLDHAQTYVSNKLHDRTSSSSSSSNETDRPRHAKRRMSKKEDQQQQQQQQQRRRSRTRGENDDLIESIIYKRKSMREPERKRAKLSKDLGLGRDGEDEEEEERENDARERGLDDDRVGGENSQRRRRRRKKREQSSPVKPELLDRGFRHGGNAEDGDSSSSSTSSFENGLLSCYEGNVLLAKEFNSSRECNNVSYLLDGRKMHMQLKHDVIEDGYYYYIFYSDNDLVSNDIHAVFEIYKPTLLYENVTKACVNRTECAFPLRIASMDRVIVEVPTKDGIDQDADDTALLVSTCVPRMGVYVIFPIAVLFLVLGCAFL